MEKNSQFISMMKGVVITDEQFQSYLTLLSSEDVENKVVALKALESLDHESNLMRILLLKKFSPTQAQLWESEAPKLCKFLKKHNMPVSQIYTLKQILTLGIKQKLPKIEIQFWCNHYARYVQDAMQQLGYTEVESIEIVLENKKTHE